MMGRPWQKWRTSDIHYITISILAHSEESLSRRVREAYLLLYVVERVGRIHSKTDQNDMGIWVGQRAKTIVILLSSRIPERQFNVLAIDLDIGDVIFEDSGDVDLNDSTVRRKVPIS